MAALSLRNQATLTANALRNLAYAMQCGTRVNVESILRDHANSLDRAVKAESDGESDIEMARRTRTQQPIVAAASHRSDESHDPEPER